MGKKVASFSVVCYIFTHMNEVLFIKECGEFSLQKVVFELFHWMNVDIICYDLFCWMSVGQYFCWSIFTGWVLGNICVWAILVWAVFVSALIIGWVWGNTICGSAVSLDDCEAIFVLKQFHWMSMGSNYIRAIHRISVKQYLSLSNFTG